MLPVTVLYCLAVVVSTRPTSSQPTVDQRNDLATSSDYKTMNEILEVMQSQIRDLQNLILTKFNEIDAKQTVECPSDFTQVPNVNGCYKLIQNLVTWQNASAQCRSLHKDSDLVVVNSPSEQNAVVNLMRQQLPGQDATRAVWTAGQRIDPSSNSLFVWKVRRMSSTNFQSSEADTFVLAMTFTNWNTGEPNYGGLKESCMELHGVYNYLWNDADCSIPHFVLCEIDL
jgi:hypothetical protein